MGSQVTVSGPPWDFGGIRRILQNEEMNNYNDRAVLFDMDGLMLDTERIYVRVWQEAAQRLGHDLGDELFISFVGLSVAESERRLARVAGDGFSPAEFRHTWTDLWQRYLDRDGIAIKPGLVPLLDWLDLTGVPRAVVTSTEAAEAADTLMRARLAARFTTVVTGDQVVYGKPAPDIFVLGSRRLGVEPSRCIVLEDSEAGVRGAHAAGMRVIMVPDLKQPSSEVRSLASAVVPTLHEALLLVQAWL